MRGCWLVTTLGSRHVLDLDGFTYVRHATPGHRRPRDSEVLPIIAVLQPPQVGWSVQLQLAGEAEPRLSSTITRVEEWAPGRALPDWQPPQEGVALGPDGDGVWLIATASGTTYSYDYGTGLLSRFPPQGQPLGPIDVRRLQVGAVRHWPAEGQRFDLDIYLPGDDQPHQLVSSPIIAIVQPRSVQLP